MNYNNLISTRNLNLMPDIKALKRICITLAVLDIIFLPDEEIRQHFFYRNWSEGEQLAKKTDGEGNECFVLFGSHGVFITGCGHESLLSPFGEYGPPKEIFNQVPPEFQDALAEPAFSIDENTFCLWHRNTDINWQIGAIPFPFHDEDTQKTGLIKLPYFPWYIDYLDGSANLLQLYKGEPQDYLEWISSDGETLPELTALAEIYAYTPLTPDLLTRLNSKAQFQSITEALLDIGYVIESV